ncbi:MAG TPA: methyltransferase domain-containing protein [Dehalococcoidia bacterium]|nr:methyltransferase domain-containing protein [Dehalococcoidia bacterium]
MPFSNAEFDFVISSGSLRHWNKPIEVFNEIHRVFEA